MLNPSQELANFTDQATKLGHAGVNKVFAETTALLQKFAEMPTERERNTALRDASHSLSYLSIIFSVQQPAPSRYAS